MKRAHVLLLLVAPSLALSACSLAGGDTAAPGADRTTLVVLGDSLTAAVGRDDRDWLVWADPQHRFELLANAGVPGDRTDQILARVERDVIVRGPQWATVLAGTNDIGQHIDALTVIANLTQIYDLLAAAGIGIIALTIPPMVMLEQPLIDTHRAVNEWLREHVEADWPGAVLADWNIALSADGDGISPSAEWFADGVHFTAAGAEHAGQAIRPALDSVSVGESRDR